MWESTVLKRVNPVNSLGFWKSALSKGVVGSVQPAGSAPSSFAVAAVHAAPASKEGDYKLVINAGRILGDGAQANNAFLQETADPVSKVTWDGYVAISLADAGKLGLRRDAVVQLTVGDTAVRLPAFVQVGTKAGTLEVCTGWGRTNAGMVALGGGVAQQDGGAPQQVNAFQLAGGADRWGIPVKLDVLNESYKLAELQGHDYTDGRKIALDDTLENHQKDPSGSKRKHLHEIWKLNQGTSDPEGESFSDPEKPFTSPNNLSLFDHVHVYPGRRWGMSIDLNACTGCNACVVACSIENNVPVVGRDEVRIGREMHWLRIDRYYATYVTHKERLEGKSEGNIIEGKSGSTYGRLEKNAYEGHDDAFFDTMHQPMLCQQCGHAPCEEVCPAMATMHNDEGQNVQVYNRCIGTRYCANNCPYKVRRFNFYEYSKYRMGPIGSGDPLTRVAKNIAGEMSTSGSHELKELPLNMLLNPAVTVRSKGVMEKCNFCIQRTRDIRDHEKRTNRKYDDGDAMMTSACAQTCPTSAIVFGDINDPDSAVSQHIKAHDHGYKVLDYMLNTRPSITYLKKVRNRPADSDEYFDEHAGHGHSDEHADEKADTKAAHAGEEAH